MIAGRNSAQTSLRLPDGMRPLLASRAARNGRSMNSEIVQILDCALRSATATTGEGLPTQPPSSPLTAPPCRAVPSTSSVRSAADD